MGRRFAEKPGEACGVFGAYASGTHIANLIYFGLFALQHRGQESAGIAVSDGDRLTAYKNMGLLSTVFDSNTLAGLLGDRGIGHTRYSTTGSANWENAQPAFRSVGRRNIALGHNGNLTNTAALAMRLGSAPGTTDSELMTSAIAEQIQKDEEIPLWEAIAAVLADFEGAYSLVVMDDSSVVAARDPHGFRPLSLGKIGADGWAVASETAALDLVGASSERDVEPGEIVALTSGGVSSWSPLPATPSRLCVFEYVYFARPDSVLAGQSVHAARVSMGRRLARESPVPADVVVPVPESGIPAAQGYARESGIPYADGLVKNRYVGRTFIEPEQMLRDRGIRLKLNPIKETLEAQRVILVDDSVVRGSTTKQLVELVRAAGARQVHLRVSSPPYRWPCFYGMDTSDRDSLLAADRTEDDIAEFLGVDSLGYLTLEGLRSALPDSRQETCDACLTGDYPTPIGDHKYVLEKP